MGTPFLGEIKMVAFNFPPKGYTFCNGQNLPINQNQALFSLLGTFYGGNGVTTFALPNLEGCSPLHFGNGGGSNYVIGQLSGQMTHTIVPSEMAAHTHAVQATSRPGTIATPGGNLPAAHRGGYTNSSDGSQVPMAPQAVTSVGGSQPHNNMAPYLVINFCIALVGAFPARN